MGMDTQGMGDRFPKDGDSIFRNALIPVDGTGAAILWGNGGAQIFSGVYIFSENALSPGECGDGFIPDGAVAGDDDEPDGESDDGADESGDGAALGDEGPW